VNSSAPEFKDILISFTWKPVAGSHKIAVVIDPDNSIVESNEKNNEAVDTISIESQNIVSSFLAQKGTCPIILVIIAAMIMGLVGYYVLRKRKQKEV
jgi:uncharacterized protein HemX